MGERETFESDREADVAAADNVLDLELAELAVESQLLDDACVLARCQTAVVL